MHFCFKHLFDHILENKNETDTKMTGKLEMKWSEKLNTNWNKKKYAICGDAKKQIQINQNK